MIYGTAKELVERAIRDHSTWENGKCACGQLLPHVGLSGDRHREHLAAEITDVLNDADLFESDCCGAGS